MFNLQEKGIVLYYEMMKNKGTKGIHPFTFIFEEKAFRVIHRHLSTSTVEARILSQRQYDEYAIKRANDASHREILPAVTSEENVILVSCDEKFITTDDYRFAREWFFRAIALNMSAYLLRHRMGFKLSMEGSLQCGREIGSLAAYKVCYNMSLGERLAPSKYRQAAIKCKTRELQDDLGEPLYSSTDAFKRIRLVVPKDLMYLAVWVLKCKLSREKDVYEDQFREQLLRYRPEELYQLEAKIAPQKYDSEVTNLGLFLNILYDDVKERIAVEARKKNKGDPSKPEDNLQKSKPGTISAEVDGIVPVE